MTKYSVTGPDGARYRIEGPEGMSDDQVIAEIQQQLGMGQPGGSQPAPEPEPLSWGEYAKGLGREAVQGATFGFSDELGLTDRAASEHFGAQYPIASTVARLAGGVAPFVAGPGAAVARLAIGRTLPRTIARSAGVGAGAGALSGAGAGEGDIRTSEGLESRLESARMGGLFGAGIGAAAPPVIGALGVGTRAVGNVASRLTQPLRTPAEPPLPFNAGPRGGPPVEGARFVNEMPTPQELATGQTISLHGIRDAMLRGDITPDNLQQALTTIERARSSFHNRGTTQDVAFLVDLDESLRRYAGTLARQSPEAARIMAQAMQGRQTGITPMGADAGRLAQQRIPTQGRFDDLMTGAQADEALGTTFGAGANALVRPGQGGRIRDTLERFFARSDKDFHGTGRTGLETVEQIVARADEAAATTRTAAYKAHARSDFRATIDNVFTREIARLTPKEAQPVISAIGAAQRLFQPGQRLNLELFDSTKKVLDNRIKALLSKPGTVHVGGVLNDVKNRLLVAVDRATGGGKSPYRRYRNEYAGEMDMSRGYLLGRHALDEQEALRRTGPLAEITDGGEVTVRHYLRLRSTGERKMFREGLIDALTARAETTPAQRGTLDIFETPRVRALLRATVPERTMFGITREGRLRGLNDLLNVERLMPETRQTVRGGSQTAERVQDDLMTMALQTSQSLGRFRDMFTGNQSLYQLGERVLLWIHDRAFGPSADAAREGARMLFTANPAERDAVIRQLIAIWPADRVAHFNELLRRVGSAAGGSAAGAAVGAPQGGPVSL